MGLSSVFVDVVEVVVVVVAAAVGLVFLIMFCTRSSPSNSAKQAF
jgi:NADH:ubiquinone oxidoreductase subunit 6 (subunit J)